MTPHATLDTSAADLRAEAVGAAHFLAWAILLLTLTPQDQGA